MNTATARTSHPTIFGDLLDITPAEQLTLLPNAATPARFRLSKDTRERGLRHVAEIRQMLAARAGTGPDLASSGDVDRADLAA